MRAEMALKVKPYIEERARERARANLKQNTENTSIFADSQKISANTDVQNSAHRGKSRFLSEIPKIGQPDESGRTVEKLAAKANVSRNMIQRVEKILEKAEPEVIEKARSGEISINQAYQTVKPAKKQDCSILSTAEFSALLNFQECL